MPEYLKVVKNMKKFITIKKIENASKNDYNTFNVIFIDILIICLSLATLYYIYFINNNYTLKVLGVFLLLTIAAVYIIRATIIVLSYEKKMLE